MVTSVKDIQYGVTVGIPTAKRVKRRILHLADDHHAGFFVFYDALLIQHPFAKFVDVQYVRIYIKTLNPSQDSTP